MNDLQRDFLMLLKANKSKVDIYLRSGIKIQGEIEGFDDDVIFIGRGDKVQMIYKTGILTLVPGTYHES